MQSYQCYQSKHLQEVGKWVGENLPTRGDEPTHPQTPADRTWMHQTEVGRVVELENEGWVKGLDRLHPHQIPFLLCASSPEF